MTVWATMLVPAGSVVVGAVIAGGAAVASQVFTHRRRFQREREARRDAFKVARFEIERATLLSLQDALLEHVSLVGHVLDLAVAQDMEEAARSTETVLQSELKLAMLTSRCLAQEAVESVNECVRQCRTIVVSLDPSLNPAPAFKHDQSLLGAALRQDPFNADC
jgi:hypothetical protein